MQCPNCEELLVMTERQGVEIDYCPKCRGVWLDKGELDKIIEKSTMAETNQQFKQNDGKRKQRHDDDDDNETFFNQNRNTQRKRKGGFLGDLFDFG